MTKGPLVKNPKVKGRPLKAVFFGLYCTLWEKYYALLGPWDFFYSSTSSYHWKKTSLRNHIASPASSSCDQSMHLAAM